MTYKDIGFDKFLSRKTNTEPEILEDEASLKSEKTEGGSVSYGQNISPDGKLTIYWDETKIIFKDGSQTRVQVGYFPEENKYGLRIIDSSGVTQVDQTY